MVAGLRWGRPSCEGRGNGSRLAGGPRRKGQRPLSAQRGFCSRQIHVALPPPAYKPLARQCRRLVGQVGGQCEIKRPPSASTEPPHR